MSYEAAKERSHGESPSLEQKIEATDKLLRETVECLSRHYPTHSVWAAACDSLVDLRPHLEEGLSALANIERRRELTDQECSWQRAFRIVLSSSRA